MGNNATGSGSPRKTPDLVAYEKLPPQVRKALQESLNDWSADACLKHCQKHGWLKTIEWIRYGDSLLVSRGWRMSLKIGVKNDPSPARACKVPILRANW
jgi:hypothetical protein